MKVFTKKRKHKITLNLRVNMEVSMLKYHVIWYVSFIALYIWFMYWVACDFFVLHKPVSEVNPVNYVGAIAAIALIWIGAKILKPRRTKTASVQQELLPPKLKSQPPQRPVSQKPVPQKQIQKPVPQNQPPRKTAPTTAPVNCACTHYIGYLNQREKSQEIPAECVTCEHVIKCMSSTK